MAHRMPDQVSRVFRLTSNNDKDCLENLRMDMTTFARLCYLLHNVGGLSDSKHVRVEEKVCFFLSVLAHHKKNVTVKFDHVRSGHTWKMDAPWQDGNTLRCLGALDGMYINVQTPLRHKPRYRNRKGGISVNVLGVVDRIMNFVYMLPGWEGSAADGRGLLLMVGCCGTLGVRYHLDKWAQGCQAPQDQKELFDQRHSKARNIIERTWGIMKWRWAVLRSTTFYPLCTQNRMILACALLHNFICREMEVDPAKAQIHEDYREFYNDDLLAKIIQMDASGSFTTSCWGRKPVVCRRMWTRPEDYALIQALKEILTSGWKADNGFRVGYLNVLQDKIMKVFLTTDFHAQPYISSKMHAWKKQYNTLYVIFGASGVGWNSTTKMIETNSDGQWEADYRANGNGVEDFHDAFVGVIHKETETQPQSPPATNLEDIDTPDSPLAEEVSTTPVCELCSSTTTKPASKGKRKLSEGIVSPIMEGLNNFTKKMDSRLGDIIGKMGHEHESTRKCESVYHIVNEIPDLTLDDKLVATNMIVKNTQVLAMFFSLPQEAKVGQMRLMLAGKI
ncbi:hypothetical protein BUALT_Bualt18G0019500 [Buddleja alternifolia]|uniref:Uncharacterized protein n=1 Tax=Buddleja alternifolia TaxID=168488 RepID=A0AAV6W9U4_9LAMI|nr:hypothetical protein BUALT_Bualt18G0019500 [Buddleja alternifolia]